MYEILNECLGLMAALRPYSPEGVMYIINHKLQRKTNPSLPSGADGSVSSMSYLMWWCLLPTRYSAGQDMQIDAQGARIPPNEMHASP